MFGRKQVALRDDIEAAKPPKTNPMLRKTWQRLETKLMNNERVIGACEAFLDKQAGVLVHTNYRLLFTADSVAGVASEAVALERVSSVRWHRKGTAMLTSGALTVNTANREMEFTMVPEQFGLNLQSVTA